METRMDAWISKCETCPWKSRSARREVTERAGQVHEFLTGHTVTETEKDPRGWVR